MMFTLMKLHSRRNIYFFEVQGIIDINGIRACNYCNPKVYQLLHHRKIIAPNVSLSACRNSVRDCVAAVHPSELQGIEIHHQGRKLWHMQCVADVSKVLQFTLGNENIYKNV